MWSAFAGDLADGHPVDPGDAGSLGFADLPAGEGVTEQVVELVAGLSLVDAGLGEVAPRGGDCLVDVVCDRHGSVVLAAVAAADVFGEDVDDAGEPVTHLH